MAERDGDVTVFVEVKERHGARTRRGHEAVTFGKRRRIVRAARLYAAAPGLTESAAALRRDLDRLAGRDGRSSATTGARSTARGG